jgi:RNA polymerase sigma-70 factor (ECF subfamily)
MNHPDRFLPLFLEVQPDLRAFIGAMVRDPAAREDVFQEVSMILWKSFQKYDPARPFGAWARGIAARKILEDHRLRSKLPESMPPEVIEDLAKAFEPDHTQDAWQQRERALADCIQQLPQRSGELIADRYAKGRSIEDLSTDTGMSSEAIYQALSRLRKQLRECVTRKIGQINNLL